MPRWGDGTTWDSGQRWDAPLFPARLVFLNLETAMEITAEDAEDADNAEEEGLRGEAAPSIAFTKWVGWELVSVVPSKSPLFRVFRVLRVVRGNFHRRFQVQKKSAGRSRERECGAIRRAEPSDSRKNANGVPSLSPGLRAARYPGLRNQNATQP